MYDHDHQRVRAMFDQLTDEERAAVLATLDDQLARGWIPKPGELADIIGRARAARDALMASYKTPTDRR